MLQEHMVHDCTLYSLTTDEYNNIRSTNPVSTTCWFREINNLDVGNIGREEESADAMAWFRPSETISEGDVLTCQDKSYRIIQVIQARRLGEETIQFIKTFLERFDSFVS